jgi:hypothetical protein
MADGPLQPRAGDLRRADRQQHQRRVELAVDDARIEGNAREDDARSAAGVQRDREMPGIWPCE